VKSVLLYRFEKWRTTKTTIRKDTHFHKFSPEEKSCEYTCQTTTSNSELWQRNNQSVADDETRRWRWTGYTMRKPSIKFTNQVPKARARKENSQTSTGGTWRQTPPESWRRLNWTEVVGLQL
jgi:hypothetical protein